MKYKLSFCEIEQLSDEIFEVTVNEGAVIDEKCAEEGRIFWHDLRTEPYRLLVNNWSLEFHSIPHHYNGGGQLPVKLFSDIGYSGYSVSNC